MGKVGLLAGAAGVILLTLAYGENRLTAQRTQNPPTETGTASWYGREEEGRPTASGETFHRHMYTAASRHLPFNTMVRVTNERNGRTVNVRINDRGPYAKGRILDLSEAAADSLDMKQTGTAPVRIEIVAPVDSETATLP